MQSRDGCKYLKRNKEPHRGTEKGQVEVVLKGARLLEKRLTFQQKPEGCEGESHAGVLEKKADRAANACTGPQAGRSSG